VTSRAEEPLSTACCPMSGGVADKVELPRFQAH
jgi:hypothetical protein